MPGERMTDKAVYLGDGVWWRVSARLVRSSPGILKHLPVRIVGGSDAR
jgi:hypothetical protein